MTNAQLIVVDPGHFHAALVQKEMYPWLAKQVSVYAPLGPDVLDYLDRIALFNRRPENPTSWEIELHTGPDFFERMLREKPGNAVVLTGRNRPKMERIRASVEAGLNVLADKPWIITSAEMPVLQRVLNEAGEKGLVAYDIMTERYEITSILQRELVNDEGVFGHLAPGSGEEPGISAKSIHHLMKLVAGMPLRRPAWFFDVNETGEGLADVGTHVVDLVQWTAFADKLLDYKTDVRVLSGRHWPTVIPKSEFQKVTGEPAFPPPLETHVHDEKLQYFCNNSVHYTVRGIHVTLEILWNWEAPPGAGDMYEASFHGTKARVEIRQGAQQQYLPELYVVANSASLKAEVFAALKKKVDELQKAYPGVAIHEDGDEARLSIPQKYRVGHEAHFAQVTNRFFDYLKAPRSIPGWEKANMLVKYFITTGGVELSR
ncbi:MAG TPA: putative oxidoreductase C-terminal domain-containing protein [Bryobacteraceae bacterium]|nr:putative oxidoreductase C-terminal domain-containing protein [Bryobacteraceae bacterium]